MFFNPNMCPILFYKEDLFQDADLVRKPADFVSKFGRLLSQPLCKKAFLDLYDSESCNKCASERKRLEMWFDNLHLSEEAVIARKVLVMKIKTNHNHVVVRFIRRLEKIK